MHVLYLNIVLIQSQMYNTSTNKSTGHNNNNNQVIIIVIIIPYIAYPHINNDNVYNMM